MKKVLTISLMLVLETLVVILVPPTPATASPAEAPLGPAAASALSAGYGHTCVIDAQDQIRCWGENDFGELGNGAESEPVGDDELAETAVAVNLGPGRKAVAVAAGGSHTCALMDTGRVRCWGLNTEGQLGFGDPDIIVHGNDEPVASRPPLRLGGQVRSITAGRQHTCALLADGDVRCWGANTEGQVGIGTDSGALAYYGDDESVTSQPPVELGRPAVAVEAGRDHTCAILDNGSLRCWGDNERGALGIGNNQGFLADIGDDEPVAAIAPVPLGENSAVAVTAGEHTCVVLDTLDVRCWGNNSHGQLGLGNNAGSKARVGDNESILSVPVVNLGNEGAIAVSAGSINTCAQMIGGSTRCWGGNGYGVAGIGRNDGFFSDIGDNEHPVAVPAVQLQELSAPRAISSGDHHTCAVIESKMPRCWGLNDTGQLGLGSRTGGLDSLGDDEQVSTAPERPAIDVRVLGYSRLSVIGKLRDRGAPYRFSWIVERTGVHVTPYTCDGTVKLGAKGTAKVRGTSQTVKVRGEAKGRFELSDGRCVAPMTLTVTPTRPSLRGSIKVKATSSGTDKLAATTRSFRVRLG